jgi:hypothetical protein
MIPKSVKRFPACAEPWQCYMLSFVASADEGRSDKIMRKQMGMTPKSVKRFPACAEPWQCYVLSFVASADEGRSDKIMRKLIFKMHSDSS